MQIVNPFDKYVKPLRRGLSNLVRCRRRPLARLSAHLHQGTTSAADVCSSLEPSADSIKQIVQPKGHVLNPTVDVECWGSTHSARIPIRKMFPDSL
jgi:hypothetical protein